MDGLFHVGSPLRSLRLSLAACSTALVFAGLVGCSTDAPSNGSSSPSPAATVALNDAVKQAPAKPDPASASPLPAPAADDPLAEIDPPALVNTSAEPSGLEPSAVSPPSASPEVVKPEVVKPETAPAQVSPHPAAEPAPQPTKPSTNNPTSDDPLAEIRPAPKGPDDPTTNDPSPGERTRVDPWAAARKAEEQRLRGEMQGDRGALQRTLAAAGQPRFDSKGRLIQPRQPAKKDPVDPAAEAAARERSMKPFPGDPETLLPIGFDDLNFPIEQGQPFERSMLTVAIESLKNRRVRIKGYMLPSYQNSGLTNFVLVRDNQECCFGPGAMLYDCVMIQMAPSKSAEYSVLPVTVEGRFTIEPLDDGDGNLLVVFQMTADSVK